MVGFTALAAFFAASSVLVNAAPLEERKTSTSGVYSGQATWFTQNGNPGACGDYNSDSTKLVALDSAMYSQSLCGKEVKITNSKTGATVNAIVADECPTCASAASLDLSVAAFEAIGNTDDGIESITWEFVSSPSKRSTYSGTATYFYQNGNPGACGNYNKDSAYVIAVDSAMYKGSQCGKKVKITNKSTGKSITATVADMCPSCISSGSIDLSVGAFQALASLDQGVFPVSWQFIA